MSNHIPGSAFIPVRPGSPESTPCPIHSHASNSPLTVANILLIFPSRRLGADFSGSSGTESPSMPRSSFSLTEQSEKGKTRPGNVSGRFHPFLKRGGFYWCIDLNPRMHSAQNRFPVNVCCVYSFQQPVCFCPQCPDRPDRRHRRVFPEKSPFAGMPRNRDATIIVSK